MGFYKNANVLDMKSIKKTLEKVTSMINTCNNVWYNKPHTSLYIPDPYAEYDNKLHRIIVYSRSIPGIEYIFQLDIEKLIELDTLIKSLDNIEHIRVCVLVEKNNNKKTLKLCIFSPFINKKTNDFDTVSLYSELKESKLSVLNSVSRKMQQIISNYTKSPVAYGLDSEIDNLIHRLDEIRKM